MDEPPIPLAGKTKRLKSLNEFTPPYWKGLFQPAQGSGGIPIFVIVFGLAIGATIGFLLVV